MVVVALCCGDQAVKSVLLSTCQFLVSACLSCHCPHLTPAQIHTHMFVRGKHVQMIHVYTAGRQFKSRHLLYIAILILCVSSQLSFTHCLPFILSNKHAHTQSHSLSSKPSTPTPPFPREQKRETLTTEVNFIPWTV